MQVKADEKTIDYTLCQDGDTTKTIYVAALPPNRYPIAYFARVKTAWAGTTSLTVELGLADATTEFIPKQLIDRVGDLVAGAVNRGFCPIQSKDPQAKATSQQSVIATFRGADLTALSAGVMQFVFVYAE